MKPTDWRENLGRLGRLTRKELSETLRDRRTIVTLVLMPLLLYPLLTMAFLRLLPSTTPVVGERPLIVIGFGSDDEEKLLAEHILFGQQVIANRPPAIASSPEHRADTGPKVVPDLRSKAFGADLEKLVRSGEVHLGIRVPGMHEHRWRKGRDEAYFCELLYLEGSEKGRSARVFVERCLAAANDMYLFTRLGARPLRPVGPKGEVLDAPPIVQVSPLLAPLRPAREDSGLPLSTLLPLILILMTMTGAVYPAIDLTAGERERGTLEVLVAAPIPRLGVLLAKYVAVLSVATLTALVNLGTMFVMLQVTPLGGVLFPEGLSVGMLLAVLCLMLLFASFFSAVLLAITSFARSFKEAQAYLIPLMLVCLAPGVAALLPGLSLDGPLAILPLINIVLLARDVFDGSASVGDALVVVVATLLYALAAIAWAARIFGTEAVLSTEQSGWSDLFTRPAQPRAMAETSSALLCLALMFPVYFLVNAGLAQTQGLELLPRLVLAALAQVGLFAVFPAVSAYRGRVQWDTGFRLGKPPWLAWGVATLLGVSLWPFAEPLIEFQRTLGVSTLGEEHRKRIQEMLVQWRELPLVVLLVVMALMPAVLEELFFRGYLFSALAGEENQAKRAIVGSAALFAVFHLLVTDALMVERLVPSFLLGLVLGGLAWKSGSVWPGVLLHALHNGIIVTLGYHEPELDQMVIQGVAGVGAILGLVGLRKLRG